MTQEIVAALIHYDITKGSSLKLSVAVEWGRSWEVEAAREVQDSLDFNTEHRFNTSSSAQAPPLLACCNRDALWLSTARVDLYSVFSWTARPSVKKKKEWSNGPNSSWGNWQERAEPRGNQVSRQSSLDRELPALLRFRVVVVCVEGAGGRTASAQKGFIDCT